jgi:hypothetical protein
MIQALARELANAVEKWHRDLPSLRAREEQRLREEVARLTVAIVGVPNPSALHDLIQDLAATIQTLDREIQLLEKRRIEADEELRVRCAAAVCQLSSEIEGELAKRQPSLIAADLESIQDGYAAELRAAGITRAATAAQLKSKLPSIIEASTAIRAAAQERALSASGQLMQIDAQAAAHVLEARRQVAAKTAELTQRLAEHAPPEQDGLPIGRSVQEASVEALGPLRKHVLAPLLADLRYERLNRLAGNDPLQPLIQSLKRSVR